MTLVPLEREESVCQGLDVDPDWWTEEDDLEAIAAAVAGCHRCPQEQACLIWALKTRQQGPGVMGGFWFQPPTWRDLVARRVS